MLTLGAEFWKDSIETLQKYLDAFSEQFSIFDTPLHCLPFLRCLHMAELIHWSDNFKEAGDQAENYDLRKIWDGTLVQSNPLDAVTLVDSRCIRSRSSRQLTRPNLRP